MQRKLLSICIPTYNRDWCIKKQIERLWECSAEIFNMIEIIISDNYSTDQTQKIVKEALDNGFPCTYIRNSTNIGMDGNFAQCFQLANGKYIWLLGDDDFIIISGLIELLTFLNKSVEDYGIIHYIPNNSFENINIYTDREKFLIDISYNMTFISGCIVNASYVSTVNFKHYDGTIISQVPLIMNSILGSSKNVLWSNIKLLDPANDYKNNGGYNFFNVFVVNLLSIWNEYVNEQRVTQCLYNQLKRNLYSFIFEYTKKIIIQRELGNIRTDNALRILIKYYGKEWYFWWMWFKYIVISFMHLTIKVFNKK